MSGAALPADARDDAWSVEALLISRSYLYELFHKCLGGEPCPQLVELLASEQTAAVLDEYASEDAVMASLRDWCVGLADAAGDANFLDAMHAEYQRAFVGPGELAAVPWESPNVNKDGMLFQERMLEVRAAYAEHGLRPRFRGSMPDDHVSLLCAFASRLAREALEAFEAGQVERVSVLLREQRAFVDEHLANWLPDYDRDMRRVPGLAVYNKLVAGLAAFVQVDQVFLNEAGTWAENLAQASGSESFAMPVFDEESSLALAKGALEELAAIRPKHIEENELCDL